MTTDDVQPLNYSAHAVEDLLRIQRLHRRTAPQSAASLESLIGLLRSSVKFRLPNCCDLLDPTEFRQAHLDLLRLPFPCVALEAPWIPEIPSADYIGGQHQSAATKRIALCWEVRAEHELLPAIDHLLDRHPGGGVCVIPVFWGPEFLQWVVPVGGTFVPYGTELASISPERMTASSRIERDALIVAGQVTDRAKGFEAEPFVLLPELFERSLATYGGREQALAHVTLDSHDEVMMLIQACAVLNCANVTTADLAAPAALNKKRQAKGKQPFFSYKVLQLTDDRPAARQEGEGGHHAGPRMHLRRGHLRRLEKKTVWVRPSMVSAQTTRGIVLKDYALRSPD